MKAKTTKVIGLLLSTLLIASLLSGCGTTEEVAEDLPRIVEVSPDQSGFPHVFVDDGDSFIFDYRVTGAKFVDSITDTVFKKSLTPKGKYLVVEFSAVNRSQNEEYGNLPLFQLDYNGKVFDSEINASVAEQDNIGLTAYTTEKVRSARKGKYVKVFDLDNYDESVSTFKFLIDLAGATNGVIDVDLATLGK